jgi:hypothetical protein
LTSPIAFIRCGAAPNWRSDATQSDAQNSLRWQQHQRDPGIQRRWRFNNKRITLFGDSANVRGNPVEVSTLGHFQLRAPDIDAAAPL